MTQKSFHRTISIWCYHNEEMKEKERKETAFSSQLQCI